MLSHLKDKEAAIRLLQRLPENTLYVLEHLLSMMPPTTPSLDTVYDAVLGEMERTERSPFIPLTTFLYSLKSQYSDTSTAPLHNFIQTHLQKLTYQMFDIPEQFEFSGYISSPY